MEHPSVLVVEELEERGWDRDRLASEMVRGTDDSYGVVRLSLDFFFEVGPTDPYCQMGRVMCAQMDRAFGTSDGFFQRLQGAYLDSRGVRWVDEPALPVGMEGREE